MYQSSVNVLRIKLLFNQHSFIMSQFWKSEIRNGSRQVKNQGVGKAAFLCRLQGRIHFLALPASSGCSDSLSYDPLSSPSFTFKASSLNNLFLHALGLANDCLPLFPKFQDSGDYLGHTQVIQDNLPNLRLLVSNLSSSLPCKITYLQVSGVENMNIFRGPSICLPL